MFVFRLFAIVLALAAAPAGAADIPPPGFHAGGGLWSSGGGIRVFVAVHEQDGRVALCGAWSTTRQSALSLMYNRDVIAVGGVSLGGERLVTGLGFMQELREGAVPASPSETRCIVTDTVWRQDYAGLAPEIRLPRLSIVIDTDPYDTIVFRQGVRPAFD